MEVFATAFGYGVTGLVLVGGLVLSIVLWGRAPRAAGLAIAAAVLGLLGMLLAVTWVIAAPRVIQAQGLSVRALLAPIQLALNLLITLLSSGAAALLLWGIFTGRARPAPRGNH